MTKITEELLLAPGGPDGELRVLEVVTAVLGERLGSMNRKKLWQAIPLRGGARDFDDLLSDRHQLVTTEEPCHSVLRDFPLISGRESFGHNRHQPCPDFKSDNDLLEIEGIWRFFGLREWTSSPDESKEGFRGRTWGLTRYGYVYCVVEGDEALVTPLIAKRISVRRISLEELLKMFEFALVIETLTKRVQEWADYRYELARQADGLAGELEVVTAWQVRQNLAVNH